MPASEDLTEYIFMRHFTNWFTKWTWTSVVFYTVDKVSISNELMYKSSACVKFYIFTFYLTIQIHEKKNQTMNF